MSYSPSDPRPAVEVLSRDGVREAARFAKIAAELVEQYAMSATLPALEGALKALHEATRTAVKSYKEAADAAKAVG